MDGSMLSDPFGLILEVNDGYTGVEHGAVELLTSGVPLPAGRDGFGGVFQLRRIQQR